MATTTGIEWTDATWSPARVRVRQDAAAIATEKGYGSLVQIAKKMAGRVGPHCEHVSPGCEHCYAETNNHRCLPANGTGLPYDRRSRDLVEAFVDETILLEPLKWKAARKIFLENQSDIFGEWVTDEMRDRIFAVMALCPQHTFQVLTKRPERMLAYLSNDEAPLRWCDEPADWKLSKADDKTVMQAIEARDAKKLQSGYVHLDNPLPNVWLGVSVEDQKTADARIPVLLRTPAAVRFISAEPLLEQVDFRRRCPSACTGECGYPSPYELLGAVLPGSPLIDWVICGGESGPGARPMHPDWARGLREQCVAAGVPFFFKQWGEWAYQIGGQRLYDQPQRYVALDGRSGPEKEALAGGKWQGVWRVGKKVAGRLLDGKEWHQFPEVRS